MYIAFGIPGKERRMSIFDHLMSMYIHVDNIQY